MNDDRRVTDIFNWDAPYGLAVLYTVGYLGFMFLLMFNDIPPNNREIILTLVGIMSAAEMGIIKFFYDGSKGAERVQAAGIARAARTDTALQEIAKAAPAVASAAVAAATGGAGAQTAPTQVDTMNVQADTANVTENKS